MKASLIIQLILQTLCPVLLTFMFCIASKYTRFNFLREKNRDQVYTRSNVHNSRYYIYQLLIGVAFGLVSMSCNFWNIRIGDAIINVRDASPITAGLLFGGPAGIIAGLIGGISRYFFGGYTQIACSLSTCLAGFYTAFVSHFLFDDHKPNFSISFATGVVMEVFHLSMVYITHPLDLIKASTVVKNCTIPLVVCNSLSVIAARVLYSFMTGERRFIKKEKSHISNIFQRYLFILVLIAFVVATTLLIFVQRGIAKDNSNNQLKLENEAIYESYQSEYGSIDIDYNQKIEHYIGIANNAGIVNDGSAMIAKESGKILSGAFEGKNILELLDVDTADELPIKMRKIEIDGTGYFAFAKLFDEIIIITVFKEDSALFNSWITIYIISFLEVFVFASIFIVAFMIIKKTVTDNVVTINRSLRQISDGYLETKVQVNDNIEFKNLSEGINKTVDSLNESIEKEKKRLNEDLLMAHEIQLSALPIVENAFPTHKEFDIYALMNPAKEVGGDFYDFYLTDKEKLAILVADVSGKGVPAAMFMMRAKSTLKSLSSQNKHIGDVFEEGNASLCEGNNNLMFVTAWQGLIDLETGEYEFANAGHNPPLIKHKNGQFEFLKSKVSLVLAGMNGMKYKSQIGKLEPGDTIILYTDGVTEAMNRDRKLYGEDRLLTFANLCEFRNMKEFCSKLREDIASFAGTAEQFDDITILGFRYIGFKSYKFTTDCVKISDITEITENTEAFLDEIGTNLREKTQILVAIDEIYSNIANYSYGDGVGPAEFTIEALRDADGIIMTFTDSGFPYNPLKREDPNIHLSAEEREIGGLGIFMTKKTMDDLVYEYSNDKNILKVKKFYNNVKK